MSARSRLRRLAIAAAAVTLVPAFASGATASGADEPPSTPVPISTPDGLLMSYVLNAKHANHGQIKKVEAAVAARRRRRHPVVAADRRRGRPLRRAPRSAPT